MYLYMQIGPQSTEFTLKQKDIKEYLIQAHYEQYAPAVANALMYVNDKHKATGIQDFGLPFNELVNFLKTFEKENGTLSVTEKKEKVQDSMVKLFEDKFKQQLDANDKSRRRSSIMSWIPRRTSSTSTNSTEASPRNPPTPKGDKTRPGL